MKMIPRFDEKHDDREHEEREVFPLDELTDEQMEEITGGALLLPAVQKVR